MGLVARITWHYVYGPIGLHHTGGGLQCTAHPPGLRGTQDGSTSHGLDVPCSCGLAGAMVYIIPMLGLLALHVVSITTVVVWTTGCTRHLIHRHHVDLWTSDP